MTQSQPDHPPPKPVPTPPPYNSFSGGSATSMPTESNPYVVPSPVAAPQSSVKNTEDSVKAVLRKWGKEAADPTKKGQDRAGNMWQHLKTGPSFADAALGGIDEGAKVLRELFKNKKVLADGGYEKIFHNTFETIEEEQLLKSCAYYLSTSAGCVMGNLYLSSVKLAFCSDSPLSYEAGDQTEWSYYKVVIPLVQLKEVNPSTSRANAAEYIQVISVDNHEFWFMASLP